MEVHLKQCSYCKKSKPGFAFSINRRLPGGLENRCKQCIKEHRKPSELEMLRKTFPEDLHSVWND